MPNLLAPSTASRHRGRAALATVLGAVLAVSSLGACGGSSDPPAAADATPSPVPARPEPSVAAPPLAIPEHGALTVRAGTALDVVDAPGSSTVVRELPATNDFGSALALLVVEVGRGDAEGWLQVLLPGRPNGATGWVHVDDVDPQAVSHELRVDLAARTLTVLDRGQIVLTTAVAIGDPDHPTPTGRFSLTDKLATGDDGGPYGPFALGLSGRSQVLTEFAGGDGQIGIHGTDDPASIGQAVSHGCVRVPNDVATRLAALLPLGTPVVVV